MKSWRGGGSGWQIVINWVYGHIQNSQTARGWKVCDPSWNEDCRQVVLTEVCPELKQKNYQWNINRQVRNSFNGFSSREIKEIIPAIGLRFEGVQHSIHAKGLVFLKMKKMKNKNKKNQSSLLLWHRHNLGTTEDTLKRERNGKILGGTTANRQQRITIQLVDIASRQWPHSSTPPIGKMKTPPWSNRVFYLAQTHPAAAKHLSINLPHCRSAQRSQHFG